MSKLVRFDDDHWGYLIDGEISMENIRYFREIFDEFWPGKRLLIISADEFIDLEHKYILEPV